MPEKQDEIVNSLLEQTRKMSADLDTNKHKLKPDTPNVSDILSSTIKPREVVSVGGKEYKIVKYTTREWCSVTPTLGRIFAPAGALLMQGSLDEGACILFAELDGGVSEKVISILLDKVTLGGEKVTIESFDDPFDMLEVCTQVIKLNYEKVFTKGMQALMECIAQISQATSTL